MRIRSVRRRSFRPAALVLALSVLAITSAAEALTINTATSSIDQGFGCTDSFCAFDIIYELDASSAVSGTFDITAGTLSFAISLPSATFSYNDVGSDGGVTSVDFTGVTYSGSFAVVDEGGGLFSFQDQSSTVSVSGTLTPNGAGAFVAFNLGSVNTTGICNAGVSSLTCGLQFGAGFSPMPISVNAQSRYFRHTLDIRNVPEPSTALLVVLGLAALAHRRSLGKPLAMGVAV